MDKNERFIQLLTLETIDELTDAERNELRMLISENPYLRNKKEIIKDYWKRKRVSSGANTAMFKKLQDRIKIEENANDAISKKYRRKISLSKIWYSAAAVLLLSLSLIAFYRIKTASSNQEFAAVKWLQKTTKPAVKSIIKLSDGSVVTLNSATTLKFPEIFEGKTREVYLDGEAYFDVHKDHLHPFIIHTNKMNVRVLGTSFNVKSYATHVIPSK